MLGKVVVETGLVTPEEIEMCNTLLRESAGDSDSDQPRTLVDLLIENEFLTKRQIERVQGDFEAKKSSQRIPGYKIIRKLGSGAMATVFLAKQLSLDRNVAIKVLPKKFSDNTKFIERFYKEGRAAAKLNHPNIVGAYDVGNAGDHHFFVMEYVDGETVYDRVIKDKRMSESEAIDIVKQVAMALQHAHEKGFIHRDIKPKNIMISSSGTVKLADLGLARAMTDLQAAKAEAGRAYGTPYYISPEQIRGEMKIGPPADIYGLGATFYHMVTGRLPFEGRNPSSVMHKHLKSPLVPPDHVNTQLSAGCAQVIEMMMSKSVDGRYQNAADLLEDLELISKGQPPHFAHKGLTAALSSAAIAKPSIEPTVVQHAPSQGTNNSQLNLVLLVMLIASVLLNAVLAIVLLV
jgi:serine/threonine protein kinase